MSLPLLVKLNRYLFRVLEWGFAIALWIGLTWGRLVVATVMEATGLSLSGARQCAQPWSRRIEHQHRGTLGSQNSLSCRQKVVMKLDIESRLSCSVQHRVSSVRAKRFGFSVVEAKPRESTKARLGLARSRSAVVCAKKEDVEHQDLEKAESNSSGKLIVCFCFEFISAFCKF